jgi:tetratricopeptide (TPR) repeat protein
MLDTGQIQLSGEALLWFQQGLAEAAAERYEQAIASYGKVLEVRADFYEAWYERALALEHSGYYADAIANFDRALSLRPPQDALAEIWHDRGNAFQYGLGDYDRAIACYDEVLQLQPNHELAWQNRGNALLYGLTQTEAALQCYDRTLRLNPENWLAWRNRGNALVELERHREAIDCYNRALAIKPDDDVSWHARNLASDRLGLGAYRQPTTQRAWSSNALDGATAIDDSDDSRNILPSQMAAVERSFTVALGQPLLVVEDDRGQREILLDREQYQIGRDPAVDICLHSKFVSRHHAVLTRTLHPDGPVGYKIIDGDLDGKASTNGILINAQKYRTAELCPEDVIIFGPGIQATYRLSSPI